MTSPETTPVLVGVGQILQREPDFNVAAEPLDLMRDALQQAIDDCGSRALADSATSVRVARGIWRYNDPAKVLAEDLGLPANVETGLSPYGGNMVQTLVNSSALDIQAGKHDVILIAGAECGYSRAKARKAGVRPNWREAPGTPVVFGEEVPMVNDHEQARGLKMPIQFYPMFENALRHSLGLSIDDHLIRISELWSRFSEVAAGNPNAWMRDAVPAEEIRTPSASNRPVSFPYPKLMNSNNSVDMGAALVLCSLAAARRMGVDEAKIVYLHSGADAHDTYYVSNRDNLYTSPAIRVGGRRVLELAGLTPADVAHCDFYSCFPVAVQIGAAEVGFDLERPLTVTGGLTFGGGPMNNYVMHSIARMAEVLRADPGSKGLVTANGGFLTKHAFGVYSTEPPAKGYQHQDVQAEVDTHPTRELDETFADKAPVEAYTVMYGTKGPAEAYVSVITSEGKRAWGRSTDPDVMDAMTREEFCGRMVTLDGEGGASFSGAP
ncbi:MAG: acetyl-CoA acetyltransferase [Gammaproteobacteria bacterium]|nr:acetyl-CoA acetyltransferase [Gammaproteobacteria bacterium]